MTSESRRTDDLFSLEKLRRCWKAGQSSQTISNGDDASDRQGVPSAGSPRAHLARLRELVRQRFSGSQEALTVLDALLDEIEGCLSPAPGAAGAATPGKPPPDEGPQSSPRPVGPLLDQLEDILEAFEFAQRTR